MMFYQWLKCNTASLCCCVPKSAILVYFFKELRIKSNFQLEILAKFPASGEESDEEVFKSHVHYYLAQIQ